MKKVIAVVVALAVIVGAVVIVKPDLLESVFPGLFVEKHKDTIRRRATELITCLAQDNFDRCVDYIEPAYVRENGAKAVKLGFGIIAVVAKAAKLTPADVQITDIQLTDDNRAAVVQTSLRIKGEWKVQKPGYWVRVDGQWYSRPR